MANETHIRDLINRLARLDSAQGWTGDLNPTQLAMLSYLGQANRFSKSPSHVAEYLGTTRGTATQSLKSLQQKGYVAERRSEVDKRVISYELTVTGREMSRSPAPLQAAVSSLSTKERQTFHQLLQSALLDVLARNKGREFGLCKNCQHHQESNKGPYCALLDVELTRDEADQICYEQVSG
ncbi:MarR family winged helix-turn-helix transcriptional regulator [Loktanella sp. Alg231-35]|uniref:MarR family winged helix-turn-helix transcriptional regulator n=1 Tax=Loktanella sp. Alg231-35 TaxID=1922220 RepID=UPI000D552C48|nr:MarR family transcriptional regulator [Loktanella sp. Alg231-35]